MKKAVCLVLALIAACGISTALADTDLAGMSVASGNVAAVRFEDVTAPWSGTLLPFDWAAGDAVSAGELMFTLRTETVFAPEDGKVEEIFAAAGDDAAAVMNRYGALMTLEGGNPDWIQASTASAYQKKENKVIHVGETLYFRSEKGDREEGSGRVISVTTSGYTVEITDGSFEVDETLNLYRKDDYAISAKVGSGKVFRRNPVSVAGQGRVAEILVSVGDTVKAGQPLMRVMSPDAEPGASADVRPAGTGVVAQVYVLPGMQVWKGQALARVWHTDALEVVADVDEVDLKSISVGSRCPIVLDMDPDTQLTGTVTEIGGMGVTRQNAAYYQVHFALDRADLPLGASASVYLPK